MITKEDKILIKKLWESKGYGARWLIQEFPDKNWNWRGRENFVKKVAGLLDRLMGNDRPHTLCSCVVLPGADTDWWCSWRMANKLASLCLSQSRTFWTCFVTINLFALYLMNFVSHHAWCSRCCSKSALKSMKCEVSFSQGSVSTIFRWGGHFFIHV